MRFMIISAPPLLTTDTDFQTWKPILHWIHISYEYTYSIFYIIIIIISTDGAIRRPMTYANQEAQKPG